MSVNVEPPAMETRSLLLRRLVVEDAAAMLSLSNEVTTPTSLPSQVDRDHAHDVAIEHRIERVLLGHVGLSPLHGEVETGFSMTGHRRGLGLATEAIGRATAWAFQAFELDRTPGLTAVANVASRRTLERAGSVHEEDRAMKFHGAEEQVSCHAIARDAGIRLGRSDAGREPQDRGGGREA